MESEIVAYGYGADGIYGQFGTTLLIDGRVYSETASAISSQGVIDIGASAEVSGLYGVSLFGDYLNHGISVVSNAGSLTGTSAGIYINGGHAVINNSGMIAGNTAIYHYASYDPGEILTINNTGTIKGTGGIAILGAANGSNFVTNQGKIEGDVILGGNSWLEPAGPLAHVYDGRGGTISGVVYFNAGNDIAYGGDNAETFMMGINTNFVDGGGGIDTLNYNFEASVDLRITVKQQTCTNAWDTIQNVENLNGSIFADRFIGNTAANTIIGNGGNDTLDGYDGNDLLSGGTGDDLLVGSSGSDTAVFTGKFSDYTIAVGASGSITVVDKRASGDGTDVLGGVEFALFSDRIFSLPTRATPAKPPVTPDTATAPDKPSMPTSPPTVPVIAIQNLKLAGSRKGDILVGGKGHDLLNGGLGRDMLTGDEGQDIFIFSTKLGKGNTDRITDFNSAEDMIQLSKAAFGKIAKGVLKQSTFYKGVKAQDKNDRIGFNEKTGDLFYDADGSGTKYKAITFAKLEVGTAVAANDFWIA